MKTLEFKPLATNIVTLHQKYRGECQKFVDYMLRKWWHVFEFGISDEDAKALFREMKTRSVADISIQRARKVMRHYITSACVLMASATINIKSIVWQQ